MSAFADLAAQGNTCAEAILVGVGEVQGTTVGAPESGRTQCDEDTDSPARWFRFVPPQPGILILSTCGSSFDTVLSVYSSCSGGEHSELECNDDACVDGDFQSIVELPVRAETSYWIRIAGFGGDTGPYTLTVELEEAPAGSSCEEVVDIALGQEVEGRTFRGVRLGTSECGSRDGGGDAVYRFVAPESCLIVADTCRSVFDTVLSVHTKCPPLIENQLRCSDDACGTQSSIAIEVEAGETYFLRVSGYGIEVGPYRLGVRCEERPDLSEGPDLKVTGMDGIVQVEREGDAVAISMETTLCNVGSEPVDWYRNPDPRHPFLVFNAYRLWGGRLVQIGQSWVKHGFSASQQDGLCLLPCIYDENDNLGSGCADVYSDDINTHQPTFGPRAEIDPRTGEFEYEGSHIATASEQHGPLDHRLVISDDDLDPTIYPDAEFFAELVVVSPGDVDRSNNLGWQQFFISRGGPGEDWSFDFIHNLAENTTVLTNLEGATQTEIRAAGDGDGERCYLSSRVTRNDDGTYRYEYALFNFDVASGIEAFALAIPSGVEIHGAGFYSSGTRDSEYETRLWEFSHGGGVASWSTEPFESRAEANPLFWGTLYNFWFDSTGEPTDVDVALRAFVPAGGPELVGRTTGPSAPRFKRSDANADGTTEISDAIYVLSFLFTGGDAPPCPDAADANDSDDVDLSDGVAILAWLFRGGALPPAPGPGVCGPDPTPSALAWCVYAASSCE